MSIFTFPYRREKTRDGTIVYRPCATIELQSSDGRWEPFELYADAGADLTLLNVFRRFTVCYDDEQRVTRFILR